MNLEACFRLLAERLKDEIIVTSAGNSSELWWEITRETDPCERMEALAPGLKAALLPDWRGGACAMVRQGGVIAVGDRIRIEETWTSPSQRSTTSATFTAAASSYARI